MKNSDAKSNKLSRRRFLKNTALLSGSAVLATKAPAFFAAGSDKVRVAIVGCGDRGTYDLVACLKSDKEVELIAIADMFQDKVDTALAKVRKAIKDEAKIRVTADTIFLGFDAYKKVLAMKELDIVLLTTPPGFRPVDPDWVFRAAGAIRGVAPPGRRSAAA